MDNYRSRNTKLNSQVMNNVRMRKSVFTTLCRGGLICLLFLMPWFSNLHAQSLGVVGIDKGNDKATLNILDDDNLNTGEVASPADTESIKRRTVVIERTSMLNNGNGYEQGSLPVTFAVRFYNNVTGAETKAVEDVWVTFKIEHSTAAHKAKGGTTATPTSDVDFLFPTGGSIVSLGSDTYKVKIPQMSNISETITLPVNDDNRVEGDETLKITLLGAETEGTHIPSRSSAQTTFSVGGVLTPLVTADAYEVFTIYDNDNTSSTGLQLRFDPVAYTITEGAGVGATERVYVKLPVGYVAGEQITVNYNIKPSPTSTATYTDDYTINANGGTASSLGGTIVIPEGSNEGWFEITAVDDTPLYELDEYVYIEGDGISGGSGSAYAWKSATDKNVKITIVNNPSTPAGSDKINIVISRDYLHRGGSENSITVKATTVGGVKFQENVTVTLSITDLLGAVPSDYTTSISSPIKLTILAKGTESGNVTITGLCPTGTSVGNASDVQIQIGGTAAPSALVTGVNIQGATDGKVTIKKTGLGGDITSNTGSLVVCEGVTGSYTLSVPDPGLSSPYNFTYQWSKDGTAISGATNREYTFSAADLVARDYTYTVLVNNGLGCSRTYTTGVNGLKVKPQPAKVVLNATTANVCGVGSSAIDVISASSVPANVNYYWFKQEGVSGTPQSIGTNMLTYNASETVSATTTFYYWVEAEHSDGLCRTIGDKVSVTFTPSSVVIEPPKIVSIPNPANLCGGSVTLYAYKAGIGNVKYDDNAVYHWSKVGSGDPAVVIVGDNTYHPTVAGEYRVVVYVGGCPSADASIQVTGSVTSSIVKPILNPSGTVETCGNTETIKVTNRPDNTYDIIWFKSGVGGGEIAAIRNFESYPAPAGAGYYVKFEKAGCQSVPSEKTTVNKKSNAINIVTPVVQPDPATTNCGGGITLNISNKSAYTNGENFQWYKAGSLITGATGDSYYVPSAAENGQYYVVATVNNAACGGLAQSESSNIVTVTISGSASLAKPKITSAFDPSDPELCIGAGAMVLLTAESTGAAYTNVEYLWYYGTTSTEMNYLATTTGNTYSATKVGWYTVIVKSTAGATCPGEEAKSAAKEVIAGGTISFEAPRIAKEVGSAECAGGSITLYVTKDNPSATANDYQWYHNGVKLENSSDPSYGKGKNFTAEKSGDYKVVLTLSGCSAESNTEKVDLTGGTTLKQPDIQPYSVTGVEYCDGDAAGSPTNKLRLYVANTTDYSTFTDVEYIWYNTSHPGAIKNAMGKEHTLPELFVPMSGYGGVQYGEGVYYVVVREKATNCQSVQSKHLTVKKSITTTELKNPVIVSNTFDNKFCENGSTTLSVTNTADYEGPGRNVIYTWYKSGSSTPVSASGVNLPQHFAKEEGYYYVEVKEGGCVAYSNVLYVKKEGHTDLKKPTISSEPANGKICDDNGTNGGSIKLIAKYWDGGTEHEYASDVTFDWYLEGKLLSAADYGNGHIILTSKVGNYTVTAKSGDCQSDGSDPFKVEVNTGIQAPLAAKILPGTGPGGVYVLPIGGTVILKAEPINGGTFTAPGLTFEWYRLAKLPGDAPKTPGTPILFNTTTNPELPTTVTGEYIVVVIADNDCRSEVSNKGTVIQGTTYAPEKPYIKLVDGSNKICVGAGTNGSVTLKAVPNSDRSGDYPTNYKFIWYLDENPGSPPGKQLLVGEEKAIIFATKPGDYYVVAVNTTNDASPESDKQNVEEDTFNNAPATPDIEASSTTICENGSVVLMAKLLGNPYPTTGYTFKWYKSDSYTGATTEIASITGAGANTYVYDWTTGDPSPMYFSVKVVDANCASDISPAVQVDKAGSTIVQRPILSAYNNPAEVICTGGTVTLIASGITGVNEYHWYKEGEHTPVVTTAAWHTVNSKGNYYVLAVSKDGCYSQKSNVVEITDSGNTINPAAPTISADNKKLCLGGVVRVEVSGAPGSAAGYRWYLTFEEGLDADRYKILETTDPYLDITETGKGDIKVQVSYFDGNECVSNPSLGIDITVDKGTNAPNVKIDSSGMTDYCAGLAVELKVTPTGASKYVWYLGNTKLSTTSNIHMAQAAGVYKVYVYEGTAPNACVGMATLELFDGGGSCMASYIELVVGSGSTNVTELNEGTNTTISARLKNNLVATAPITIDLSEITETGLVGEATRVSTCAPLGTSNGGDDYWLSGTTLTIQANNDVSNTVNLNTCLDQVYESDEVLTINAKLASGAHIQKSPHKITIKDVDAGPNGELNLIWKLVATTHSATGRLDAVYKGEHANFEVIAVGQDGVTPIKVQHNQTVGIAYNTSSTAKHPVVDYTETTQATILAGDQSVVVKIQTYDDNVVETSDLVLLTNIKATHISHSVQNSAEQTLYIASQGKNALGGFDFIVSLSPNEVYEDENGSHFSLTITLDANGKVLGESVNFNLVELAASIAELGIDYNMPSTITMPQGVSEFTYNIDVIDNEMFDGDRLMVIDVLTTRKNNLGVLVDQIVTRTPNPLQGMIKDNDKLCLTITSEIVGLENDPYYANMPIKGIDETYTDAKITVEVHNLSHKITTGVTLLLENQNTSATHYYPVNELSPSGLITLSSAKPSHEFTIKSTLVPSGTTRENFDVTKYTSVYEELLLAINFTYATVNEDQLDCYEPLTLVISDDFDKDGLPNWLERNDPSCNEFKKDSNDNGIPNEWDPYDPNGDDDGDGIPNWMEDTNRDGNPYNDWAGDSCLPNFMNTDSDGDGVPDSAESWTNRPYDNNKDEIRIHPALSLNDDGIGNDLLYIENIHKYKNKVTVFDRQGVIVFETDDYRNTADKAFNGIANKAKSGKKVPLGTYFVIVEYEKDGAKKYYDKAVEVRY